MAVSDWNTNPALNDFVGSVDLREGIMTVANVNNAIREMMAQIKAYTATVPDAALLMPKTGGAFTGPVTFAGYGHILYRVNPLHTSGKVHTLGVSDPLPALADGDAVERG
jgi:hypothetical protein